MVAAIFDYAAIKHGVDRLRGKAFSGRMFVRNPDGTQTLYVGEHDFGGRGPMGYGHCRRCDASRESIADKMDSAQCSGVMPTPGQVIWESRHMMAVFLAPGGGRYWIDKRNPKVVEAAWRDIKRILANPRGFYIGVDFGTDEGTMVVHRVR